MTNRADPDQLASEKPTDLDLHCLLRQGMSYLAREGLIVLNQVKTTLFFYLFDRLKIGMKIPL